MNPLKLFKTLFTLFAGEIPPSFIAYGVALGLFAALTPQGTQEPATWFLVLVLLTTRASMGFFMLVAALVKGVMALGLWKPVAATGRAALELGALEGFWRWLLNAPIGALCGLDRHGMVGGLIWAFVLSAVLFIPVIRFVTYFRETLAPKMQEMRIVRWLRASWFGWVLQVLFFGARRVG